MNLHVCDIDLQAMRPISPYWCSALRAMSKDSKINKFPRVYSTRSIPPEDLYRALADDQRFIVGTFCEDQHLTEVSVVRKKGKNRKT